MECRAALLVELAPGEVLFLLLSHQGLSGKSGPRGERGPTVSVEGRHGNQEPKRCIWVFLTTPLPSL